MEGEAQPNCFDSKFNITLLKFLKKNILDTEFQSRKCMESTSCESKEDTSVSCWIFSQLDKTLSYIEYQVDQVIEACHTFVNQVPLSEWPEVFELHQFQKIEDTRPD